MSLTLEAIVNTSCIKRLGKGLSRLGCGRKPCISCCEMNTTGSNNKVYDSSTDGEMVDNTAVDERAREVEEEAKEALRMVVYITC